MRWVVRAGAFWRMIPHHARHPTDLLPWHVVYGQAQRWLLAGVFEEPAMGGGSCLRLAEPLPLRGVAFG